MCTEPYIILQIEKHKTQQYSNSVSSIINQFQEKQISNYKILDI